MPNLKANEGKRKKEAERLYRLASYFPSAFGVICSSCPCWHGAFPHRPQSRGLTGVLRHLSFWSLSWVWVESSQSKLSKNFGDTRMWTLLQSHGRSDRRLTCSLSESWSKLCGSDPYLIWKSKLMAPKQPVCTAVLLVDCFALHQVFHFILTLSSGVSCFLLQ